jgi:hypothetical protein
MLSGLMQFLTADQKQQQYINVCNKLHQIASDDATFLSKGITGDQSKIYNYALRQSKNPPNGKVQPHRDHNGATGDNKGTV